MKMPKQSIDTTMFAPCGINCKVCYRHCNHKNPCGGCLNGGREKPSHCRKCSIKTCVGEQGLTYCYECALYPCKRVKSLDQSYRMRYQTSPMQNSLLVEQQGLFSFLKRQKEIYTCPVCGGIISLHDGACSECFFRLK